MRLISDSERDRLGEASWVLASIAERPLMYLPSVDLLQFVSYLEGFDRACGGGALLGFREWVLVVRGGHPERAWWSNLLEAELSISDERELHDETAHLDAIRRIVSQFIEFRRFVAAPDGWTRLFRDYDEWHKDYLRP